MIIVLARGTEHEASILRLRGIMAHAMLARRLVIGDNGWKLETLGDGQKTCSIFGTYRPKVGTTEPFGWQVQDKRDRNLSSPANETKES